MRDVRACFPQCQEKETSGVRVCGVWRVCECEDVRV